MRLPTKDGDGSFPIEAVVPALREAGCICTHIETIEEDQVWQIESAHGDVEVQVFPPAIGFLAIQGLMERHGVAQRVAAALVKFRTGRH